MNSIKTFKALSVVANVEQGTLIKRLMEEKEQDDWLINCYKKMIGRNEGLIVKLEKYIMDQFIHDDEEEMGNEILEILRD